MKNGFVISDLHIFRDPHIFDSSYRYICQLAAKADLIVLNGDIFDFEWSQSNIEKTVHYSTAWIKELIIGFPNCSFVFISGNHDCDPLFAENMHVLEEEYQNIKYREEYYVIENKLFLHGDIIHVNRLFHNLRQWRLLYRTARLKTKHFRHIYLRIIPTKVSTATYNFFHHKERIFDKLILYIQNNIQGAVTEIYFGHIHVYFEKYAYKGYVFNNPGAAIKDMQFKAVQFEYLNK
ncbi:MAG: hypothetical protein GY795_15065 [Desulfobacterales bacterium]|nr:hypothetical protein [Desulfobacterales bacterium]